MFELNITVTGTYSCASISSMGTYGYLYANQIDRSNLSANLVASNGGTGQFQITFTLQAGVRYIFIFTTYYPSTTGSFSLSVSGPSVLYVRPTNLISPSTTTGTTPPASSSTLIGTGN